MDGFLKDIKDQFQSNIDSVIELIDFDRDVMDFAITRLKSVQESLEKANINTDTRFSIESHTKALEDIRRDDRLKPRYESILNQGLVLLVSYFTSALEDIFRTSIQYAVTSNQGKLLPAKEALKITIEQLNDLDFELKSGLGDLIMKDKSYTFQDMKSTERAFDTFFGIKVKKDMHTNNIIFAHACRHCIIHALGKSNEKMMNQIKDAFPREVKKDIKDKQEIKFDRKEIEITSGSMKGHLFEQVDQIDMKFNPED